MFQIEQAGESEQTCERCAGATLVPVSSCPGRKLQQDRDLTGENDGNES
jgi:hypothetical protein